MLGGAGGHEIQFVTAITFGMVGASLVAMAYGDPLLAGPHGRREDCIVAVADNQLRCVTANLALHDVGVHRRLRYRRLLQHTNW